MTRLILTGATTLLLLAASGCSEQSADSPAKQPTAVVQQPAMQPAAKPLQLPMGHPPTSRSLPKQVLDTTGKVLTVEQAKPYTYLEVITQPDNQKHWLAAGQIEVTPGESVRWSSNSMVMKNFKSKSLDRVFDEILFVNTVEKTAPANAVNSMAGMSMPQQPQQGADVATPVAVQVNVSLDEKLSGKVSASDTVFVFARMASGMPMPLAVARLQVSDLPASIKLDDSMAMMAGHSMADKEQVVIGARVSKAGSPMPAPGDLEGLTEAINPKSINEVSVQISRLIE